MSRTFRDLIIFLSLIIYYFVFKHVNQILFYSIYFTSNTLIVLYSHSIRFSNIWLHSYNDTTTLLNVDVVAKAKLRWKKLSVLSTVRAAFSKV